MSEVEFLQVALQKAKRAAAARPVQVLAQNAEVIERSRRVANLEKDLAAERAELEKAVVRQEHLRQEVEVVPPIDTHASCTDVAALKATLAMVEAERDALRSTPPRPPQVQRTDRRSLVTPSYATFGARRVGGLDEGAPGPPPRGPRVWRGRSSLGTHIQGVGWGRQNDGDGRQDGPMSHDSHRDARYGLRGIRMGEAHLPRVTQIDSDEEPIMSSWHRLRLVSGETDEKQRNDDEEARHVVPRWGLARPDAQVLPPPTRRLVLASGADQPQRPSRSVVDAFEFDMTRLDFG